MKHDCTLRIRPGGHGPGKLEAWKISAQKAKCFIWLLEEERKMFARSRAFNIHMDMLDAPTTVSLACCSTVSPHRHGDEGRSFPSFVTEVCWLWWGHRWGTGRTKAKAVSPQIIKKKNVYSNRNKGNIQKCHNLPQSYQQETVTDHLLL